MRFFLLLKAQVQAESANSRWVCGLQSACNQAHTARTGLISEKEPFLLYATEIKISTKREFNLA